MGNSRNFRFISPEIHGKTPGAKLPASDRGDSKTVAASEGGGAGAASQGRASPGISAMIETTVVEGFGPSKI